MESATPMYEEFYGLTERPFLTVPDPEFLYWSDNHLMAFTMLRYGIMTRAPITVVTGEIGAGKTTLLRHLLRELPEDLTVGLISNMQDGRGEVLHWAMMALDQPFDDEPYVKLFKRFQDHLIDCYAAGRRVLLIVDEAQELSTKSLEELRMFSNINSDKDELLQLILVGQPQLRDTLSKPELTQFSQRISSDFHLGPLNAEEVAQYIHHRLAVAGATWKIFSDRTCELVHEATGGVPRLVNILCQLCMVYGFSYERKVIDEDLLRQFLDGAKRHGIYRHFSAVDTGPKLVRTQA
jgi:type II secretory pathway predicted ATPase ExeA